MSTFPTELTSHDEKHGQKHFISITPFLSCSKETRDKDNLPGPNDVEQRNGRSRWDDVSIYTALLLKTDDGRFNKDIITSPSDVRDRSDRKV